VAKRCVLEQKLLLTIVIFPFQNTEPPNQCLYTTILSEFNGLYNYRQDHSGLRESQVDTV